VTKAENDIDTSFSLISPPVNIGFPSLERVLSRAFPSLRPLFNPRAFIRRATLDRIEIVTSGIRLKYAFTLFDLEFIHQLSPTSQYFETARGGTRRDE